MAKDDLNMDDKQIKIKKWDYVALKITLDDAVKKVFITKYNHIEDFSLIDFRILMGTLAVLFATFALIWDFFYPFPKSRFVLAVCVALFYITKGAIILYTTYNKQYSHIEDFSLSGGRLYYIKVAVLFAAFTISWDFFNPFPNSRFVFIVCVALYNIIKNASILYATYMEKDIFAVTLERDENGFNTDFIWEVSSYIKKHTGMYYLTIIRKDSVSGDIREREICKSVANYFNDEGILCQNIIENEVTKVIEAVLKLKKIE